MRMFFIVYCPFAYCLVLGDVSKLYFYMHELNEDNNELYYS